MFFHKQVFLWNSENEVAVNEELNSVLHYLKFVKSTRKLKGQIAKGKKDFCTTFYFGHAGAGDIICHWSLTNLFVGMSAVRALEHSHIYSFAHSHICLTCTPLNLHVCLL
jgi:hypothetical protein